MSWRTTKFALGLCEKSTFFNQSFPVVSEEHVRPDIPTQCWKHDPDSIAQDVFKIFGFVGTALGERALVSRELFQTNQIF